MHTAQFLRRPKHKFILAFLLIAMLCLCFAMFCIDFYSRYVVAYNLMYLDSYVMFDDDASCRRYHKACEYISSLHRRLVARCNGRSERVLIMSGDMALMNERNAAWNALARVYRLCPADDDVYRYMVLHSQSGAAYPYEFLRSD